MIKQVDINKVLTATLKRKGISTDVKGGRVAVKPEPKPIDGKGKDKPDPKCVHYWKIEPPQKGNLRCAARCLKCKGTRKYPSGQNPFDASYNPEMEHWG